MAKLRLVDPHGTYHVMSRGNYRAEIYLDDDHLSKFVSLLNRVANKRAWIVLDWCLMPNHFHLVIRLTEAGLSEGMRELNGCFSRWSNQRTGRTGSGHLVKNRFKALELSNPNHFWSVLRYVPLNPVKANLVSQPEEWPWSGYRASIGLEHARPFHRPSELLRCFASAPGTAVRRYQQFILSGRDRSELPEWSDQNEPREPG